MIIAANHTGRPHDILDLEGLLALREGRPIALLDDPIYPDSKRRRQKLSVNLTEKEFLQHLNTKFLVNVEAVQPVELELVEVKGYESRANEQAGLERFSVFFSGPAEFLLPQNTYALTHEKMGKFDIFIVPIGRVGSELHYEAVFNYQK